MKLKGKLNVNILYLCVQGNGENDCNFLMFDFQCFTLREGGLVTLFVWENTE